MHFHVIAEDVPCVLSAQINTRVRLFRVFTLIDVGVCVVFVISHTSQPKNCGYTLQMLPVTVENSFTLPAEQ